MRVTGNSYQDALIQQLNLLTARQYRLQNQAATGQRIQSPDDDPAGLAQTLNLQSESSRVTQFTQNIGALQTRATSIYNALQGLKTISDRAGEIATSADGTKSPADLKVYAAEVTQLIHQAVQLMNSKDGGQSLFAGTRSDQPAFVETTDANGNVTGVTYQGNTSVSENEIAENQTLSVDAPGENNSGSGPSGLVSDNRHGADLFGHLIALQNHLLAGDTSAIANTDRSALAADEDNILYHVSNNGAVQSRLEAAASVADSRSLSLQKAITQVSGADLTATIVQLSQAQTNYQAALQSSASILQLNNSLLNYLQ